MKTNQIVVFVACVLATACPNTPEVDNNPNPPAVVVDGGQQAADAGPSPLNDCADDMDCSAGLRCNEADRCVIPCHRDGDCNDPALTCGEPLVKGDATQGTCQRRPGGAEDAGEPQCTDDQNCAQFNTQCLTFTCLVGQCFNTGSNPACYINDAGHAQDAGTSDASAPADDAGTQAPDAGYLDVHCQRDVHGNLPKAFLMSFGPYDYLYNHGRAGAKVIQFYVAACSEAITMDRLQIQVGQYEESAQHPQAPDDPTGLLLANGIPALSNETLQFYSGYPVPVTSVAHGDSADDVSFVYFNLQSAITLQPGSNMTFSVTVNIGMNTALAGQQQSFHIIPQVHFTSASSPYGDYGLPFTNGSGEWPKLTVQYGEASNPPDAGVQTSDAGAQEDPCAGHRAYSYFIQPDENGYSYATGTQDAHIITFAVKACENISIRLVALSIFSSDEYAQNPQAPNDPTGFILGDGSPAFLNPRLRIGGASGGAPAPQNQDLVTNSDHMAFFLIPIQAVGQNEVNVLAGDEIQFSFWADIPANPNGGTYMNTFSLMPYVTVSTGGISTEGDGLPPDSLERPLIFVSN